MPLRIGFHRDVPKRFRGDLLPRLDWTPVGNGEVAAALLVSSPNAKSIRIGLYASLPKGAQLRFFQPEGVGTPYAVVAPADREMFWSPSLAGDAIGVEIVLPTGAAGESWLGVAKVAHRFLDAHSARHKALECPGLHVDVQCRIGAFPAGLENAVARIEFEDEGESRLCSGTLLNDGDPNTSIPYMLTANRCIATAEAAHTVQATWFYQRERCGAETLDVRVATTAGGAELLATSAAHDSSLLKIRQRVPPNVYFAGWDATPVQSDDAVTGIHHPRGMVKKVSAGAVRGRRDSEGVKGAIELAWNEGATEDGSSGSALFRDGLVVGVLSHGPLCRSGDRRDFYGSFASFFPRICWTLDPNGGCGDGEHDQPSTAATIGLGSTGVNAVDQAGDVDYWRVAVPSAGRLVALTTGDADTVGALEDEDGVVLATDDNDGVAYNFRIESNVQAGIHFLRVAGGDGRLGDYELHVNHMPPVAVDALPELLVGVETEAAIGTPGNVDRWRLQLEAEGFAELTSEGDQDTVGVLEDENGVTLATDDDSGAGRNFLIERFLPAGTYVLGVSGFGAAQGNYMLRVRHASRAEVPPIADGGSDGGTFAPYEGDYWRFDVASPSVATLETEGASDTIGALYTRWASERRRTTMAAWPTTSASNVF